MENCQSRTVILTFIATLMLGATCGAAVEPPRRHSRSHKHAALKVSVSPLDITMKPGQTIRIKCRARIGDKVEDIPFINFYRKLGQHTVLPMSSGFPGVTMETVAASRMASKSRHNRAVKYLTLGPEVYRTLYPGPNTFCCKASKMNGSTSKPSHFIVHKEP